MTIEELTERWEKDPNSRVFLQLAEEFRKANRFDDAIRVCQDGLKKHPGYSSARVTLARALLAARRTDEAKREFEVVLAAVPDSLLANRYLGDLYYEEGRGEDALKRYRVVQMLSPSDEEVASRVQRLESGAAPAPSTHSPSSPRMAAAPAVVAPSAPAAAAAKPVAAAPRAEAIDDAGFMDLKIDESVILNADMIAAALGAAGMSSGSLPATKAAPTPAVPVVSPSPNPSASATSRAADQVGEMGLDDFSEFSSPTVMLSAAELAKIPGVRDAAPGAVPAATAPPVVPAVPTVAAQRAQKYGISFAPETPAVAARPPVAAAAPAPPSPPSVPAAVASAAPPVAAVAAPAVGPPAVAAEVAVSDDAGDDGGMDDFSDFAAPTVMMNVADLLAAAGIASDAPASPAPPAPPAPPVREPAVVAPAAAAAPYTAPVVAPPPAAVVADEGHDSPWLHEDSFAPPSFEHEAMNAPSFEPPPASAAPVDPPPTTPAEPVFGTQLIPVADFEAMRTQYMATLSSAPPSPTAPHSAPEPVVEQAAFMAGGPPSFDVPDADSLAAGSDDPFAELPPASDVSIPAQSSGALFAASPAAPASFAELEEPFGGTGPDRVHADDRSASAGVIASMPADSASVSAVDPAPAGDASQGPDERKQKMQKLSNWLASLKKN